MHEFGVNDELLVSDCEVVVRRDVRVRRADIVLQTDARQRRRRDRCCEVLGVEVREESEQLIVGHCALVLAGYVCRPIDDVEIVREVAKERNTRSDSAERMFGECRSRISERTALIAAVMSMLILPVIYSFGIRSGRSSSVLHMTTPSV